LSCKLNFFFNSSYDEQEAFHAAYLTYSDIYDKTTNPETRKQLNQNITALQQNQIDYPTFYENIDQFRREDVYQRNYGRASIRTQKKREWRRKTQKHERIKRHKNNRAHIHWDGFTIDKEPVLERIQEESNDLGKDWRELVFN
jgi:site-specific DNA-cytosine methylase